MTPEELTRKACYVYQHWMREDNKGRDWDFKEVAYWRDSFHQIANLLEMDKETLEEAVWKEIQKRTEKNKGT